jgi:hypothetical protein
VKGPNTLAPWGASLLATMVVLDRSWKRPPAERTKGDAPNPNIALEVGHLYALRKPVCLLKDYTLDTPNSDLVGKRYDPFDT